MNVAGFVGTVVLPLLYANTTSKSPVCTEAHEAMLLPVILHVVTRLSAEARLAGSHHTATIRIKSVVSEKAAKLLLRLVSDILKRFIGMLLILPTNDPDLAAATRTASTACRATTTATTAATR